MHLLETETFSNTFGPKSQRKKPKLKAACLDDMAGVVDTMLESYKEDKDGSCLANTATDGVLEEAKDPIFSKGQSKRIWNELYKVVDSSDVVIHVLDARNPEGTRCRNVERYLKAEAPHKHLIFVLNKCDLVPTWVTVSNFFPSPSCPASFLFIQRGEAPLLCQETVLRACLRTCATQQSVCLCYNNGTANSSRLDTLPVLGRV